MTEEIIPKKLFNGKEIRILEQNGDIWFPIVDITRAWGLSRNTLGEIIDRNEKLFTTYTVLAHVTCATPEKDEPKNYLRCVNEQGLYLLMGKITSSRIKIEGVQEAILDFQKWIPELIKSYRKGEIKEVKKPVIDPTQLASSLGNRVADQLQIGDAMARYANVDRGIACSMALSKVEFDTGTDLTMWKNLLTKGKPSKRIGVLLATELGKELGFGNYSGKSINLILNKLGYLDKLGDHWVLTQRGEQYAEAFPRTGIAPSGTSYARYDIKWQPEMVTILRKHLFAEVPKPEQGLLTGYIG